MDGFFDFYTETFDKPSDPDVVPLGIAESRAKDGAFSRKNKWLEFKVKLQDLVDDFEAEDATGGKKYFDLVDVAVVWEVPAGDSIGDYDLIPIGAGNWNERDYFGATHLLKKSGGHHTVHVLALQDFLREAAAAPASPSDSAP